MQNNRLYFPTSKLAQLSATFFATHGIKTSAKWKFLWSALSRIGKKSAFEFFPWGLLSLAHNAATCSKSTMKTPEKYKKSAQS